MSKDFTPKDMYESDKFLHEKHNCNLRDMKITLNIDNKSIRMDINQYPYYKTRFPNLSFLFSKLIELPNLENESNLTFLDSIEKELTEHLDDAKCENNKSIVQQWYFGKLDKNYYYNTYNNELFYNWIASHFIT